MKKAFEYDLTKYDPSAPKKTEEFLTADGVKTLTTDANDGAVLIQDEVDEDSLNPVTGAAVAAAIEAGGGSYTAGDGIAISEGEISAKVDGTTIGVNASGELEALGGGSSYEAGDGIAISEGEISAKVDGTTIQVNGNGELVANSSGGTTVLGNDVSMNWNSNGYYCYYDFSSDVASKITTGIYLVRFRTSYSTAPDEFSDLSAPAMITAGIWTRTGGQSGFESQFVLLPSTNGAGTARTFEGTGVFTIDDPSFVPEYFRLHIHDQGGANISTAPSSKKITVVKIG